MEASRGGELGEGDHGGDRGQPGGQAAGVEGPGHRGAHGVDDVAVGLTAAAARTQPGRSSAGT